MNYLKNGARIVAQSAQPILFDAERGGFFVVEQNAVFGQPGLTAENAPLVPPKVSKLQFAAGMFATGKITAAEAEDMAAGPGIPAAIATAIAALPTAQQVPARIRVKGMTEVERASPLLAILMAQASPPISDAEMDAYFIAWSAL